MGIEALSRGARFVWFAESAAPAIRAIRENLATLKIESGYEIERHGAAALLEEMARSGDQADLVFLDPPYEEAPEYMRTLEFLGGRGSNLLAEDARVIAEHRSRDELAESYGLLERVRVLKQGDAGLSFFARRPETSPANETSSS